MRAYVHAAYTHVCVRVGAQMDGQPLSAHLSFSLAPSASFQKDLSPEKYSITGATRRFSVILIRWPRGLASLEIVIFFCARNLLRSRATASPRLTNELDFPENEREKNGQANRARARARSVLNEKMKRRKERGRKERERERSFFGKIECSNENYERFLLVADIN